MKSASKIYNYWILSASIIIWIVLIFIPNGFIPDYFNLYEVLKSGILTRIILSFTSFFGLVITVLILIYGSLKEKFRRLTLKELSENKYSIYLTSLFISIFLVNTFTAIYINGHEITYSSLNVSYYSIFLSISYLLLFLPIALISINHTDSQKLINKYLNDLNIDHFPRVNEIELAVTQNETNPITVLRRLVSAYAEKDDLHSIEVIVFSTHGKIDELIGSSKQREKVTRYLLGQKLIWEVIVHKALQKKEFSLINNIFLAVLLYHYKFSEKKIPLLYLNELSFFIEGLVEKLVKENLTDNIDYITLIFEKVLEHHYENSTPSENDLWELQSFFDKSLNDDKRGINRSDFQIDNIDIQWQKIESDIPYVYSIILFKSIENSNLITFRRALSSLHHQITNVYNSNLGDLQKAWIIKNFLGDIHHYQIEALKKGLFEEPQQIQTLNSLTLQKIIEDDFFYKKELLVSISEFLLEIHNLGKLDLTSLNILGSLGRNCSNKYLESKTYKETLRYILKVINSFKISFEENLAYNYANYDHLKDEIKSFIKFHLMTSLSKWKPGLPDQKEDIDNELVKDLENFLSQFKNLKVINTTKRIEWD